MHDNWLVPEPCLFFPPPLEYLILCPGNMLFPCPREMLVLCPRDMMFFVLWTTLLDIKLINNLYSKFTFHKLNRDRNYKNG